MKTYILTYEHDNGAKRKMTVQANDFWSAYKAAVEWVMGVLGCKVMNLKAIDKEEV